MKNLTTTKSTLFSLMLVLFIDGMGQGIIFPILTSTISNPHSSLFFSHATEVNRNLWYGILISIYFLMWFISAPVLGDWSDKVGRKKALLVCLWLAALSFLLSAFALQIGSLSLLFIGRFLGGVTSGDQAIAKAAIIDVCDPAKKAIYMGLMLFAVTLGLVIGPILSGILQNSQLCVWFNVTTPLYVAFMIAVFNIFLLQLTFNETRKAYNRQPLQLNKSLRLFTQAVTFKPIKLLLSSYFLTQTAWAMLYIFTPIFASRQLHFTSFATGLLLALIGIGIGIGLSILPSWFRNIPYHKTAIGSYSGLLLICLILAISHSALLLWLLVLPAAALFGLAVTHVLPLFSNAVSDDQQGWIMGITGSVVALTGAISSLLTSLLMSISPSAPYIFISIAISGGIITLWQHSQEFRT